MSINKLEQVMWRLRTKFPNQTKISNHELMRAIMVEIGTSQWCYWNNRKSLLRLGWIKKFKSKCVIITNNDITNNY